MKSMKYEYVTVTDNTGRNSTLTISERHPDMLKVLGGLPHCLKFRPATKRDCQRLIKWLQGQLPSYTPTHSQNQDKNAPQVKCGLPAGLVEGGKE